MGSPTVISLILGFQRVLGLDDTINEPIDGHRRAAGRSASVYLLRQRLINLRRERSTPWGLIRLGLRWRKLQTPLFITIALVAVAGAGWD